MAVITPVLTNRTLDNATKAYLRMLSVTGQTYGLGEPGNAWGAAAALDDMLDDLGQDADAAVASALFTSINTARTNAGAARLAGILFSSLFTALGRHAKANQPAAAVVDLDTLLTYYNVTHATKWQMLQHPNFQDLYNQIKGANPSRNNVYFECLQGGTFEGATFTNALLKYVISGAGTGTPTDGVDIDTTYSYTCGGIPVLNFASGWAGASDSITVTGDFYDPATAAVETNKTIIFTGVAANGRYYRGAGGTAATDALIVDVTSVAVGANITAGTLYVEAERPPLATGTSTAGAATTITLAVGSSNVDDYYNGLQIGHVGDLYTLRTISDYDGATRVATVSVAWASNPSTTVYRILRPQLP